MLPGRLRPVERPFALAAIEARHVAAGERRPEHAVAIDVAAARRVAGHRRFVHFRERRLRRIGSGVQPHDGAGKSEHAAPDRSIGRGRDRIEAAAVPPVLRRIQRLIRLDVPVALAVAVGIDHERRPSLRLRLVVRLVEQHGIQPADHAVAAEARPQCVIGVVGKHQMMRSKTGVDERDLLSLWIVHSELPATRFEGE